MYKVIKTVLILFIFINSSCSQQPPKETFLFKDVNVIPMSENVILKNKSVLIENGKIIEIASFDKIKYDAANTEIIDGRGKYLMPGLADMHAHATYEGSFSSMKLFIANGVTTIRDLGDNYSKINAWRKEINEQRMVGPTIYASSQIIFGDEKDPVELISSNKTKDCVKFYNFFTKKTFERAMKVAKEEGIYTIGHIPFAVGLDGVINYGMNEIAHIEAIAFEFADINRNLKKPSRSDWYKHLMKSLKDKYGNISDPYSNEFQQKIKTQAKDLVDKLKGKGIYVTSTMIVDKTLKDKVLFPDVFMEKRQNKYLSPNFHSTLASGHDQHQIMFDGVEQMALVWYEIVKTVLTELSNAGIPIVLGTDTTDPIGIVPGFSTHEELQILTDNGFSPYDALKTATKNAGIVVQKMTGNNDFGTIEIGKRADLILTNKNPLVDLANIIDNTGVMANGIWFERKELDKLIEFNNASSHYYASVKDLSDNGEDQSLVNFLNVPDNEIFNDEGYKILVDYYKTTKQQEKMKKVVSQVLQSLKNDPMALNNFCWYIYQNRIREKYNEAIQYTLLSIKLEPDKEQVWDTLAWLYFENGQLDEAITAMEKAVDLSGGDRDYKKRLKKLLNERNG